MDDSAIRDFFTRPTHTYHRQYEALRAVFREGRSQKDVAEEFGFEYHSLRQLIYTFRREFDAGRHAAAPPFFKSSNTAAIL